MPLSNDTLSLPRVSVIMPTLNAEALLDNVLSSIARQTYPQDKIEIILADAHSTDRTRKIGAKYGALVLDDNGEPSAFDAEALDMMLNVMGVANVMFGAYFKECAAKEKN